MIEDVQIPLFDLIICLSDTIDLIDSSLSNHHTEVAYIAVNLAKEYGLPVEQQNDLLLAGSLHDIGALSLKDKLAALEFERRDLHDHAEVGYLLMRIFPSFAKVAHCIRFHHVCWNFGSGLEFKGKEVSIGSHILHLADRIAVSVNKQVPVLNQVHAIRDKIKREKGKMFMPELVDVFLALSDKEFFWLDIVSPLLEDYLARRAKLPTLGLDMNSLVGLSKFFSYIIDFRSRFTATHSSGVAATSKTLARLIGFSDREFMMMEIAGYLHDLGKLAVPTEILEKPGSLSPDEFNIIRGHTFYTCRSLGRIMALDEINTWASFHHERIDGNGYPFHYKGKDLPLGSRIMSVADVFTAITEDRPYRKGMPPDEALMIIRKMAADSILDDNIVRVLEQNFDEINALRRVAQDSEAQEYMNFSQRKSE